MQHVLKYISIVEWLNLASEHALIISVVMFMLRTLNIHSHDIVFKNIVCVLIIVAMLNTRFLELTPPTSL